MTLFQGKIKHINTSKFAGLSPGLGGCQKVVDVFLFGAFLMGEKKNTSTKSPPKSRDNPRNVCFCVSSFFKTDQTDAEGSPLKSRLWVPLRLLNALNSEDRCLKVRFSLATIVFETFELILCQMLSSQGKNAPSNPYPHYLVRLAASRTVTASHKILTLQALSSSLNAGNAKRGCLSRGKAFGSPPAVCPPQRPRPFAWYRIMCFCSLPFPEGQGTLISAPIFYPLRYRIFSKRYRENGHFEARLSECHFPCIAWENRTSQGVEDWSSLISVP